MPQDGVLGPFYSKKNKQTNKQTKKRKFPRFSGGNPVTQTKSGSL